MLISRTALRGLLFVLAAAAAGAAPGAAQDSTDVRPEITRERMTRFTRAHLAINEARDEFHGAVARVHDEEGRLRAREEVEAKIEEILEAQEMTREEYDEITLRISLDGELRAMFEEILRELTEPGS
jgi:uncharacterized lipoprotein YajG